MPVEGPYYKKFNVYIYECDSKLYLAQAYKGQCPLFGQNAPKYEAERFDIKIFVYIKDQEHIREGDKVRDVGR